MITYVNPAFARLFEISDPQELHSPEEGTFPAEIPQGKIVASDQAKGVDIKRELQTLVEDVHHIRNIIGAQQE